MNSIEQLANEHWSVWLLLMLLCSVSQCLLRRVTAWEATAWKAAVGLGNGPATEVEVHW